MLFEPQFHPATQAMLATARALARGEQPPPIASAEPGLADRLFAIERFASGHARVRAFGDGLPRLFGRDLRGEDFAGLFFAPDRALFLACLDAADAAREPAVMRCEGESAAGQRLGLELLVAPLDPAVAGPRRLVGLIQPLGGEDLLDGPLTLLRLQCLNPPAARGPLRTLRLVISND